ncbi:hypothetical protein [Kitasatospora sp. NPDC057198]|uniref:hypothetical protein n=1 Tax=Kitasatospora sp. NPDC057198 TaxID=3346046 RepID=UPI003638211E
MTDAAHRAWEGAARLAELVGSETKIADDPEGIRITVRLRPEAPDANHREVLDVLRAADRFGHRRAADGTEHLWALYRA